MIEIKKILPYSIVVLLIGGAYIYFFDPSILNIGSLLHYVSKQKRQDEAVNCSSTMTANFFDDNWEMSFDYSLCNTLDRNLRETKVYYFLKFSPVGEDSLIGQGMKIFESVKNIPRPSFSIEIPLRVEGKIVCDSIFAKTFEKNTLGEEIRGKLMIPLTNRYVYEGIFTGSGKNCNGLIKLSRINPKELRPQYQKLYQ